MKKILCFALAMLMIAFSLPLSAIAAQEESSSLPVVYADSPYAYYGVEFYYGGKEEYRVYPDYEGNFIINITLSRRPDVDQDIVVYYRTKDDSAVAAWGDYESVGVYEDESVVLNKDNGYKAVVKIKSKILDYAVVLDDTYPGSTDESTDDPYVSRRFMFEITRVEGDAVPHHYPSENTLKRSRREFYCYLRAENYIKSDLYAQSAAVNNREYAYLGTTEWLTRSASYAQDINKELFTSDQWKHLVESGMFKLGVAINGDCFEDFWNSEGDTQLGIYYTKGSTSYPAIKLDIEGQFDESTYYGWQLAYDYIKGEETITNVEFDADSEDFFEDNFIGFTLYENGGKVLRQIKVNDERDNLSDVSDDLRQLEIERYMVRKKFWNTNESWGRGYYFPNGLYYAVFPSDFLSADSYYYEFKSDTESKKEKYKRMLKYTYLNFDLLAVDQPKIVTDDRGYQMVTTNLGEMREGDPLKLMVRFDKLVYNNDYKNFYVTAKINGQYTVKLNYNRSFAKFPAMDENFYNYCYAWDTLVFEGELPEEVDNIKITSITDIQIVENSDHQIRGFATELDVYSTKIDNLYNVYDSELRTPAATVSVESTSSWAKKKQIDVYLNTVNSSSARFTDYAVVYYQWSNSKELPESYDKKLSFHTAKDKEISKAIIGTGNGEMYLHIKTVSRYGKTSISDMLTGTYDPNDEDAVYTPFGPYKFDNAPPGLSVDSITVTGTLKERTLSIPYEALDDSSGLQYMDLYYIEKGNEDGEGILLRRFTADNFTGNPKTLEYKISHRNVGIGVDKAGNVTLERCEVDFYWKLSDKLGNESEKTGYFSLVFDTNDYLESEITSIGAYDISSESTDAKFKVNTQKIDGQNFIYDFKPNDGKTFKAYAETNKPVYYAFAFTVDESAFGAADIGVYSANVSHKGVRLGADAFSVVEIEDGVQVVLLHTQAGSGRYDIQLTRTEGASLRVSRVISVYATNGEDDETEIKTRVEAGTILSNSVYQLSTLYPYFYYKDENGAIQREHYNNTKQPATFSSYQKAKDYVYYKEFSDIYLFELNSATAGALNSGTTGYLIAKGEETTPQAGQYWIRYKSASWTPTSGDTGWVYYYYGTKAELYDGNFSDNLLGAINAVTNRIVGYGTSVTLTDNSLLLGTATGNKMLDKYGMPYLEPGQIHNEIETTEQTMCGNVWKFPIYYTADTNIYKSNISVGVAGTDDYSEYPLVGNFALPEESIFQYMTYEQYKSYMGGGVATWKTLNTQNGAAFVELLTSSGVYYIREMAKDGVAIYAIYVDREAPEVSFSHKDDQGNVKDIPIDGVQILDIRTKNLYIGSILATEYDRLSYVAIYKVSDISLVDIYTADELDSAPVKLDDGNYYIVVSDRSGNHYIVTAKVSSSDFNCVIKESTNKYIKLTCNRKSDQILRYEVYLNGELVSADYAAERSFEEAGIYTIYIQDIYGNVFSEEYIFTRTYPTVSWKYFGEDGKFHTYNPKDTSTVGFVMTEVSDNQYKISSSVKTRFSFSENYDFEFIGTDPKFSKSVGSETVVTIEAGESFTLKVYYKNHTNCYTIYSGVVDVTPPKVSVLAEVDVVRNAEYSLFDKWIADGDVGDVIKLDEIYYLLSHIDEIAVPNGSTVSSDIIRITASDANDLSFVDVYLNGKLIKSQNVESGFSQIIVSEWGEYRIVAQDALGNVAEVTFNNGIKNNLDYFIDGAKKGIELHGYLNFETVNGKHVYNKVDYGNTSLQLDIKQNADVFVSLGCSDGNSEIYGFRISDGCIYSQTYKIVLDKNNAKAVELVDEALVLDVNAKDFSTKNEYVINKNGVHDIYASVSSKGIVTLKVYAPSDSDEVVSVGARVEFFDGDTKFVSAEISKKKSNVSFKDPVGDEIVTSGTDIRANDGFTIDESLFDSERVSSIKMYYSTLNNLDVNLLDGKTNIYVAGKEYLEEGFYLLIVKNRYGNETVYRIAISRSFGVTSSVVFGDGYKIYYTKDYVNKLYSNNEIIVDVLDTDITYSVTKEGLPYTGFTIKREDGYTYLVFNQEGNYVVKLSDRYGNVVTRQLEINKSTYTVADELLTGYNDKALKRDEGYTNQKLSIDKAVYDSNGIYYLAIKRGEETRVIFDAFAEEPITTATNDLVDIIGADGDGVYTVILRNRYGTVVKKEIHYRSTPTLKLERTTRSASESEVYSLSDALSIGFWSNNTLMFSTEASTYVFTINGRASECPRTLVFESAGDYGSSEYDISYIDEYGFEYKFKAHLVRKSVAINVPTSITGIEVNGILNTKNDIFITFGDKVYATYTRNNGEEVVYNSGDLLKKDGTYRFTVIDYAGNTATVTLKKDTMVEFEFVESVSGTVIQNGSVVNSSKIGFNIINKDSAYIEKVLRNGEIQADFTGSKFTQDGKWELILCDELGNKAYFCFYMVTRSQNGFAYTTPYEYRITEVWYDSGDGVKLSYMNFVNHTDFNSSFDFAENGKYYVVMTSDVTGVSSEFEFTVNTNAPDVSLVGCNVGETTMNDVSISGCKVGDRVKVYLITDSGDKLVEEVEVKTLSTKMPTISEGGEYRIVVESEAGVTTELSFVRKHVMNTAGSVFIMIVIGFSIIGLFAGLVYRNKSKTDD